MDKMQKTIDYLRNQGRFGDTDLVHVNPEEKAMLKAMGGAGTVNPNTGLEEYFLGGFFSNPVKAITNAVSDLGSSVDDLVNEIPGGWKTVGALAAGGALGGLDGLSTLGEGALTEAQTQAALEAASKEALAGYGAADTTTGAVLGAAVDAGIPLSEEAINSYLMEAAPVEYGTNTWTGPITDAQLAQGLPSTSNNLSNALKAYNAITGAGKKLASSAYPQTGVAEAYHQANPFYTPKEQPILAETKATKPVYLGALADLLRG